MGHFITWLEEPLTFIAVVIVLSAWFLVCVQWILWIMKKGRFQESPTKDDRSHFLRYTITEFFAKIITEFRALLALIVILIFGVSLVAAIYFSYYDPGNTIENLSKSYQAIMSTLGAIVASIIGYYFGESSAKGRSDSTISMSNEVRQETATTDQPQMKVARKPPIQE